MQHFRLRFVPQWIENGFRWVVLGLFLKLVLANNLAAHIRFEETANPFGILTATYLFRLRIYFDFAGYSLIALGLAKMLGIRLTLNFRAPYAARSLREFWHRWHVTLSNWFRDYVYFPLGGSRGPFWALNLMIVFTVSGLWHGAGWNFVIWGAYHGVLLAVQRALMRDGAQSEPSRPIAEAVKWAGTYALAMFGSLFFLETDWVQLTAKLRTLADSASYSTSAAREVVSGFSSVDLAVLGLALLLAHVVLGIEMASHRKDETANPYQFC